MERDCYYNELKYVHNYACKAAGLDPEIAGWKTAVDTLVAQLATLQAQLAEKDRRIWELESWLQVKSPQEITLMESQIIKLQAQLRQVEGNENIINGVVMCDYCDAAQDAGNVTLAYPNDVLSGELKPHPTEERHE